MTPAPTRAETAALREAVAPIATWLAARDGYGFSSELTEQEQARYLDEAASLAEAALLPSADLLADRNAALAERDEARRALERDRSTVATVCNKMQEALRGRSWLLEGGRGPYAWDDDRFREEFSQALNEIAAPLDVLRGIARDWSNCPTDPAEIKAARADRAEAEPAALKARIAALEAALRPFGACWKPLLDAYDQRGTPGWSAMGTVRIADLKLAHDELDRAALAEGTGHADAS